MQVRVLSWVLKIFLINLNLFNIMKTCTNCGKVNKQKTLLCRSCYRKQMKPIEKVCIKCKKQFFYKFGRNSKIDICTNCIARERGILRKQALLEIAGTKCYICGYNRCIKALHFHHLDPKQKEVDIGRSLQGNFNKLVKEIEKTIVLCANCHAELHDGLINLESILKG